MLQTAWQVLLADKRSRRVLAFNTLPLYETVEVIASHRVTVNLLGDATTGGVVGVGSRVQRRWAGPARSVVLLDNTRKPVVLVPIVVPLDVVGGVATVLGVAAVVVIVGDGAGLSRAVVFVGGAGLVMSGRSQSPFRLENCLHLYSLRKKYTTRASRVQLCRVIAAPHHLSVKELWESD